MTIGEQVWAKVEQVRGLLRQSNPTGALEKIMDRMAEAFLNAHDPVRRALRRQARGESRAGARREACAPSTKVKSPGRRILPEGVRDAVFLKDGGRCTFVSADGRRCAARERLEADHILPKAKGGGDDLSNLRILCKGHNQFVAEQEFGSAFMARKRSNL
jgi:5-methylcytosine-specific restriction endonuclease McrA